jgi:hypothetical protein
MKASNWLWRNGLPVRTLRACMSAIAIEHVYEPGSPVVRALHWVSIDAIDDCWIGQNTHVFRSDAVRMHDLIDRAQASYRSQRFIETGTATLA